MTENLTPKSDILEVIANLSNDEVFTPPKIANAVLDLLPPEVWTDPTLRWLDPGTKTGVFLREATRRLMIGLAEQIPDEQERLDHILRNMMHGVAITELTSLMARRTLYCSKDASGEHSVVQFTQTDGNVWFKRVEHLWVKGRCSECGASQKEFGQDASKDNHAYGFIHEAGITSIAKDLGMKFDVIVGNPPYQMSDGLGGNGSSAIPLYHFFVCGAIGLNPRYMSMIIPGRWYAGGKGLDEFRDRMLKDPRITRLVDFPNAAECFPRQGADIEGGVCYYLWEREPTMGDGLCEIVTVVNGQQTTKPVRRSLASYDVLLRFNQAVAILDKVQASGETTMNEQVSARKPFGFLANFTDFEKHEFKDAICIYARGKTGWVARNQAVAHPEWVDKWKVLIGKAYGERGALPAIVLGQPIIAAPGSCCTETYLVCGTFDTEMEAKNLAVYMRTKFFRFLVSLRKNTQNLSQSKFAFVPQLDMTVRWTDEALYEKYGITEDEQVFIASMVKEMPA